jgi:phosphoglycolate phosphatase-like HAD superfamily hydrolase
MLIDRQIENDNRLVLFDIDQTLISSDGSGRKAIYSALSKTLQLDLNRPEFDSINMSGKTDPQIIREFVVAGLQQDNKDDNYWQQIIAKSLEAYLQILPNLVSEASKTPKYFMHEGVSELLSVLEKNKNIFLGLLTGNIKRGAYIKLEPLNLTKFFPIGAFGCDSASRLDLPAIAHKRAEDHYGIQLTPNQIIIIGDAPNDVLCAKHYGAISLAVSTGHTSAEELSQLNPHYLFSSLKETDKILDAIMSEPAKSKI